MANGDRHRGIDISDATVSDDEEQDRAATNTQVGIISTLKNWGCIFVKNLANETIIVYTRSAPVLALMSGGVNLHADMYGGVGVGFNFVMEQLSEPTTHVNVIDAQEPGDRSMRIPVRRDTYISIRRYNPGNDDQPANWLWDCFDTLIRTGQKLTVTGTAVNLGVLVPNVQGLKP